MKVNQIVTSLGFVVLVSACGDSTTPEQHVANAKSSIEKQELNRSEISLKNALKIDAANAEARFLLGKLYMSQGSSLAAVKELERAQSLKYNSNETLPLLARAYLLAEDYETLLMLAHDGVELSSDSKIKTLTFKSIAALRTEKNDLAQELAQQSFGLSKSHSYSLLANAYLTFSQNKNDQALALVSKALVADPKNFDALLLKGHLDFALNNFASSAKSYKQYDKAQPKIGVTKLFIAKALLRDEQYDEAEKYADDILASLAKQPFANYVKAIVMFEKKDFNAAKEYAEVALNENYNLPALKIIAGASAYHLNNFESAYFHLDAIAKKMPPNHYARRMLAISQLQLGMIDDINDTLSGFNATTPEEVSFLSSLSYQLAEVGAISGAKALFKQATENSTVPDAEQSVRSGILKLVLNDPTGMQDIKNAVELDPNMLRAQLALAHTAIEKGDFEQALSISKKWQEQHPTAPGSYNILAAVYMKKGQLAEAKEALHQSLALKADNLFATVKLINIAVKEKNIIEAKRLATQGIIQFPENIQILKLHYFLSKDSASESTAAFAKVKALFQSQKDNVNAGILYAEVLIDAQKYSEAFNVLNAFSANIKSPKRLWQLKIITQRLLQNKLQEINILENWHKINPYHVEPVVLLVDSYLNTQQNERALALVNSALANYHSDSTLVKITKLYLLLDAQQLDDATTLYQELTRDGVFERQDKAVTQGIEGRIALLQKDYPQAIKSLMAYYTKYPTRKNVTFLVGAYQGSQDHSGAIDVLEKYLAKNESDNGIRAILANFYLVEQPKSAVLAYEKIMVNEPNNIIILNNLSWLYLQDEQIDKALPFAEKAYQLAPQVPNVPDTYSQVLLKLGQKSEALAKSKEAYELSKGEDIDIALNYIEILILNSRKNAARKLLVKVQPQTTAQKYKVKMLLASL
ncbi:MAG: XrtA/PEP-CTERM system TPR-repeat protein PrsT [Cognaticolwellia sp.]